MSDDSKLRSAARLSSLWDGEPIDRVRSLGDASVLVGRRLALHLMAQPETSLKFLNDRTLRDQGLLSRVLIAAPAPSAGGRAFREPSPVSRLTVERFAVRVTGQLRRLQSSHRDAEAELPALALDPEACQLFVQWHDEVERALPTHFNSVCGFAAKLPEHAARIAGIITAFSSEDATVVTGAAMASGIRLANFYAAEAIRLADHASVSEGLRDADALKTWLKERNEPLVHLADIYQRGPGRVRDKTTAARLMSVLEEHGYVRKIDGGAEIDGHHRRDVWSFAW